MFFTPLQSRYVSKAWPTIWLRLTRRHNIAYMEYQYLQHATLPDDRHTAALSVAWRQPWMLVLAWPQWVGVAQPDSMVHSAYHGYHSHYIITLASPGTQLHHMLVSSCCQNKFASLAAQLPLQASDHLIPTPSPSLPPPGFPVKLAQSTPAPTASAPNSICRCWRVHASAIAPLPAPLPYQHYLCTLCTALRDAHVYAVTRQAATREHMLHPTAGLNCCLLGCAQVATPSSNN